MLVNCYMSMLCSQPPLQLLPTPAHEEGSDNKVVCRLCKQKLAYINVDVNLLGVGLGWCKNF